MFYRRAQSVFRLALLVIALLPRTARAQEEFVITIETTLGDTTETFWLQIPELYQPTVPCPLLIGWHQWSSDHMEMKNHTDFDLEANNRTWIAASHRGPSTTHWNNHAAQSHVVDMIRWIEDHYNVDASRIYMVGGSMGGASGMIFSNNHLDPAGPMVAAAASISGIQDCERRFLEQGINHTMIESFGGTPEEVPYEYHRNSAIYFADSTASMHRNARHLPLFLTFGQGTSDQVWREHAEDLYAVMKTFADTVVLHESAIAGHGWSCAEEELICDFLQQFTLDPGPARISINADEEGIWYWSRLNMRNPAQSFARFEATVDGTFSHIAVDMIANVEELGVDLAAAGLSLDSGAFTCRWDIRDETPATLSFREIPVEPSTVLRDGEPFFDWGYDPLSQTLSLHSATGASYSVFLSPAGLEAGSRRATSEGAVRAWCVPGGILEVRLPDALSSGPRATRILEHGGGSLASLPVVLHLYDVRGREILRRGPGLWPEGRQRIRLDGHLSQGVHLVAVEAGGFRLTPAKVCLIR